MDQIFYVEGVPSWFTYLNHLWNKRECRKLGAHKVNPASTPVPIICERCGEIILPGTHNGSVL